MRLKPGILFNFASFLIITGYLVLAGMNYSDNRSRVKCRDVRIKVADSALNGFVTPLMVERWLEEFSLGIRSKKLSEVDMRAVEEFLEGNDYVRSAQVYTNMDGATNIVLTQRHPAIRIISEGGYDFYVDSLLYILPPCRHYVADVPLVTGQVRFSFPGDFYGVPDEKKAAEDITYIKKLINFVGIIKDDDFLRSLIVQIYVDQSGKIELIPRVGNQVILLGKLEDWGEKLASVKEFYTQSFSEMWWKNARQVDVQYSGQVIVR